MAGFIGVSDAYVPAMFIARCLQASASICDGCKVQLLHTFLKNYYNVSLQEFNRSFPNWESNPHFTIDPAGEHEKAYIDAHLPQWLSCLDMHHGAQLWVVLCGKARLSELYTADFEGFLVRHYKRVTEAVKWSWDCTCPDKPPRGVTANAAQRDRQIADRIWHHYLDAGIRMTMQSLLQRATAQERAWLADGTKQQPLQGLVILWKVLLHEYKSTFR